MKNQPYDLLARHYDTVAVYAAPMNAHARRKLLGRLEREVKSVCDLACGSGETALALAQSGKEVFAVDLSPEFCKIVKQKAREAKLAVTVIEADMRKFRLPARVDLVVCEFAALNNLERHSALATTFASVKRALKPGGWFLFDVNTPLAFQTQVAETHWVDTHRFKLVMHGSSAPDGRHARVDLEWFTPSGKSFRHETETIHHVAWTDAEIRAALKRAGFTLLRAADGVEVRPKMPGMVRGTDAYYLARLR
ncbi:MAG: methyltransferase domain-containing protein [Planctomycetes bacterium]|nr:methyltransferase domain-containing protein [Planctomycetota bacterium]